MIPQERTIVNVNIQEVAKVPSNILQALQKSANSAISGDGSCSLPNRQISCFAAETCAAQQRALQFSDITHAGRTYIAYIAGMKPEFVGCVTFSEFVPDHVETDANKRNVMMTNLCVAKNYRGNHIGKRLIARAPAPCTLYLEIATHPDLRERADRLRSMYAALGFEDVASSESKLVPRRCMKKSVETKS